MVPGWYRDGHYPEDATLKCSFLTTCLLLFFTQTLPASDSLLALSYDPGAGRTKCQMGKSTLQSRDCWRPLKTAGQGVASTVTCGANGFAANVMTRPFPSLCVTIAGEPSG